MQIDPELYTKINHPALKSTTAASAAAASMFGGPSHPSSGHSLPLLLIPYLHLTGLDGEGAHRSFHGPQSEVWSSRARPS